MERLNRHESIRGWFAYELALKMRKNKDIYVVTGDLGFGMFDYIKMAFKDRFINVGAAEQAMMGVAIGLAKEGKIPFVYSITTFLIYRPFETIRNYVNNEKIPVKLVGSGRDKDYEHDGFSHWAEDTRPIIETAFPNIVTYWPETKEEIPIVIDTLISNGLPSFVSLKR